MFAHSSDMAFIKEQHQQYDRAVAQACKQDRLRSGNGKPKGTTVLVVSA